MDERGPLVRADRLELLGDQPLLFLAWVTGQQIRLVQVRLLAGDLANGPLTARQISASAGDLGHSQVEILDGVAGLEVFTFSVAAAGGLDGAVTERAARDFGLRLSRFEILARRRLGIDKRLGVSLFGRF